MHSTLMLDSLRKVFYLPQFSVIEGSRETRWLAPTLPCAVPNVPYHRLFLSSHIKQNREGDKEPARNTKNASK